MFAQNKPTIPPAQQNYEIGKFFGKVQSPNNFFNEFFFEFHLRFQAIFAISPANKNLQIDILTTDMSKLENQVGIALFF